MSSPLSTPNVPGSGAADSREQADPGLNAALTDAQAAGVDDPAVLQQCQVGPKAPDGGLPIGLGLSGMYCAACALTIESALQRVPGVRDVQVQGATQRARLVIDPARVRLSQLVRAVQGVGYRAWPDAGARQLGVRLQDQRKLLWRLLVAWFCMMQVMMVSTAQYVGGAQDISPDIWQLMNWSAWVLSLPVMLFSCGPFFSGAWAAIKHGRISMDAPVALGIAAMFGVSTGVTFGHAAWLGPDVYFDSLTMFVSFLLTGRWLESRAREKVTQSLESLSARLPEAVERAVGQDLDAAERVPLSALRLGDHVRVAVGQAFPGDGQVVRGETEVDESMLTGESRPVPRTPGQVVVAGSLNLSAPVWCRIERLGPDTRYQQIVNLVHQAMTEKPGWMRMADRFAGYFLWGVLLLALLGGLAWWWIDPSRIVWVVVSVLVVTCPCAFSLAAPSALLSAAGALARRGVLVRHLDAIDTLASVRTVLFDKTGTLSDARLRVQAVWWQGRVGTGVEVPAALLSTAGALAAQSQHPAAQALASLQRDGAQSWHEVKELAGQGLEAQAPDGRIWRLGAADWALAGQADLATSPWADARVWLAPLDGGSDEVLGFALDEQPRAEAAAALAELRAQGVDAAVLSGDQPERVQQFISQLGSPRVLSVLGAAVSPERKLELLRSRQEGGQVVAMVGDGINDAPVLASASVSFALDQGAALAQSQADFIVLGGRLTGVSQAVDISRRAMRIVRQNLVWSASYNAVCIPLALSGWLPPWLAGLGMALSSLAVVLNALRLGAEKHKVPASRA
ncbi:MAG: cation-translocating P-type ATPase [Aquabacterium sp.]|uniref:heavy metal translocating P-type ATPase n=1 Tax=Aquabacterium sp. TaxID=1872578 RepID=UPI003BAEBC82